MRGPTIRTRLTIAFFGLAILPLLVVGALLAKHTYGVQQRQALVIQGHVADGVAKEVQAHIKALVDRLTLTARLWPRNPSDAASIRTVLATLLGDENRFSELAFLDAAGREIDRQSLVEIVTDADLRDHVNLPEFEIPFRTKANWFGPVTYAPATGQPIMSVSVPVFRAGEPSPIGVLLGVIRLKKMWEVISDIPTRPGEDNYILDEGGRLIAHRNPSVVLRGTTVPLPPDAGFAQGLTGGEVLLATRKVPFGDRRFIVVAEKATRQAMALAYDTLNLIAGVVLAALAMAAAVAVLMKRRVLHPLHHLAEIALRIKDGDLNLRVPVSGDDEIGSLAAAFNSMTERLRHSLEELELRVEERTRDLTAQITERSYAERALRDSEQRFRDIAQAASDWFWEMREDLRFSLLWPRDAEIENASVFLGRTVQESLIPAPGESARTRWVALGDDFAAHRSFRDINCVLNRGGQPRFLRISGKPFFDDDGRFAGYRGIMNDMTAEAQADARALRAEQHLYDAINVISEGFVLCDAEDRLLLSNNKFREFFPDMTAHLVPGARFSDLLRRSAELGLVAEAQLNPGAWLARRRAHRDTQSSHVQRTLGGRWLLVNERRTENGNIVGVYTDITELKTSEEALAAAKGIAERATDAKSQFLANMSHELRTPLNAVIGFSDAILSEIFGPIDNDHYRAYVQDIHSSGMHLLDLINDILDLSKVEAGKLELSMHKVDIHRLVAQMVTMMHDRAATADLALTTALAADLPPLFGDERRLKQILLNLLSNAIKFTPEGGTVSISARAEGGFVALAVSDTGIGIAKADLPKVMEPFGQVESAQSRKHQGTGLGLPLTRRLVELHNGRMEIDSVVGKGTTVRLWLPAMAAELIGSDHPA